MTLQEIKALLGAVDPDIRKGFSMEEDRDYSYWEETRRLPMSSDDRHDEEGWAFYVHRFTSDEYDPVALRFFEILDGCDNVTVKWTKDHDKDTGVIHHIFDCEGY